MRLKKIHITKRQKDNNCKESRSEKKAAKDKQNTDRSNSSFAPSLSYRNESCTQVRTLVRKRFWRKKEKKRTKAIPCSSPTSSAALHFSASLSPEKSQQRASFVLLPAPTPSILPLSLSLSFSARVKEFARACRERSFLSFPPLSFPCTRTHTHASGLIRFPCCLYPSVLIS